MKFRLYTTIVLLLATIVVAFGLPKPKYQSPDIIGTLDIPTSMRDWRSKDMARELDIEGDDRYKFISNVFARLYGNRYGENLLFLVLDAGNFHHPKVCFGSSGFKIQELDDTEFSAGDRTFKAKTLLARKGPGGVVVIYWMVINKQRVGWTEQKFQQLWYQLFNKEKIGVMGRLDIPVEGDNTQPAINLAQEFIRDLSRSLPEDDAEYMFGK
ncbi:MAG: EpsI family protein [Candidatus Omnitrophica bacterium]|nr:EpsI family protein [Candidatus Omnitrophota bacterium]